MELIPMPIDRNEKAKAAQLKTGVREKEHITALPFM